MSTVNWPSVSPDAKLPLVSLTASGSSKTVYVPLSGWSHISPGAVMRYVAVRGVPSLLTSTPRNVAVCIRPFGPTMRTSLLSSVKTSTARSSVKVTVNVWVSGPSSRMSATVSVAVGASVSGGMISTVNSPSVPLGAKLPVVSVTAFGRSETVYVPLSV